MARNRLKLFGLIQILSLGVFFTSCGGQVDTGSTSINLSGAQYIAETQFPLGLMLYAENVDQPWMKIAINLSNSPADIPFPNGRYHMALVGIKDPASDGNFEAYCGTPTTNGSDVIELQGGEIILSATMSKSICITDDLFAQKDWHDTGNNKLKPIVIKDCDGHAISCATPSAITRVKSVKVQFNTFKSGPLFSAINPGGPIEMCVNFDLQDPNISNGSFAIPGGNIDSPGGKGIFNTTVKLFNAINCDETFKRKEFHYPSGIGYSWVDKSVDMSFVHAPPGISVKLSLNASSTIQESLSEIQNGYIWPVGEYIIGSGYKYHTLIIKNNNTFPMVFGSSLVANFPVGFPAPQGSAGFKNSYPFPGDGGTCTSILNPGETCNVEIQYQSTTSGAGSDDLFKVQIGYTVNAISEILTAVIGAKPMSAGVLGFEDAASSTAVSSFWSLADNLSPLRLRLRNTGEAAVFLDSNDFYLDQAGTTYASGDIGFSGGVGNLWPGSLVSGECPTGIFPLAGGESCLIEFQNYGSIGASTYHDVFLNGSYNDQMTSNISVNLRIEGQEPTI